MAEKKENMSGFWTAFGGKPKVELSDKGALAPVVKRQKAMDSTMKELFPEDGTKKKGRK